MNRINGNVTEFAPRVAGMSGQLTATCACWICQTSLSARAAFCHECGTIQSSRQVDHFTRLGLERRFDLERHVLDERYAALSRVFQAERFAAKSPRQKQLAADHSSAVEEAYAELRCPVRRAHYLLGLTGDVTETAPDANGEAQELQAELAMAADAPAIDRVAFKARHAVEVAIRNLSAAFRQNSYASAALVLASLAQFEDIAASARARRSAI